MLTSIKFAIAAAATLAGGSYALKATPSPANPPGTPRLQFASQETKAQPKDSRLDRRVSVNISGTASDVVKWLTEQGVSFVVNNEELSKGSLTLNMVDQPLADVVNAVGDALGGHWTRRGEVYVFQAGRGGLNPFGGDWSELKNMPNVKEFKMDLKDGQGHVFALPGEDGQFKIDLKGLPNSKDFKFEMPKNGKGQFFITPGKDGQMNLDLKELKNLKIDEKTRKEIEQSMKETQKYFQSDDFHKQFKELKFLEGPGHPGNAGGLIKSITPGQWAKQKSQGFLKFSDLTPAQQKMLGQSKGKGTWNIQYVIDGKKLNIRSK